MAWLLEADPTKASQLYMAIREFSRPSRFPPASFRRRLLLAFHAPVALYVRPLTYSPLFSAFNHCTLPLLRFISFRLSTFCFNLSYSTTYQQLEG
jgi:hypothetical protein